MADVDYTALRFWIDVLYLGGVIAVGIYAWVVNRSKANRSAIDELDGRTQSVERRQDKLEERVANVPTHHDLARVYDRLNGVSEQVKEMNGNLTGISRQIGMISEYLLNRRDGGRE